MKYSIAKMQARKFANECKTTVYIAKANNKNAYKVVFKNEKPSKNHEIIESVN